MKNFVLILAALGLTLILSVEVFSKKDDMNRTYGKPENSGKRIVILIRHAEKVTDDEPYLSDRGKARAEYLKNFFGDSPSCPRIIYAQMSDKKHKSLRSIHTVIPLSDYKKIQLNTLFTAKETGGLAETILNLKDESFPVLVCWSHQRIGKIVSALLKKQVEDFPKGYDTVWTVDLDRKEISVSSQGF